MKTFRFFGMALVAVMLGLAMSSCDSDDEDYQFTYENPYKDYAQLIVGKWFNFSPEASMYLDYKDDGTFGVVGYDQKIGWVQFNGTYVLQGNNLILTRADGKINENKVELANDRFIFKDDPEFGDRVNYRVKEQFDITGKYTFLNSAVRVAAKEGKTEMQLPEGITIGGMNSISVEAMNGGLIIEQMKEFFADAMFTPNAKLRHSVDGTVMYKNYALNGNNLSFDFYNGYQLNATSFPDEDGDRLFIIIPKQTAWVGGLADVIRKENSTFELTDEVIADLEKEFTETFETFTVVLSLSKTGEYNASEDVDPYKDYADFIVGKWFNFTPTASVFMNFGADGKYVQQGYDIDLGWIEYHGDYSIEGNRMNKTIENEDGSYRDSAPATIEVTNDRFIVKIDDPNLGDKENYRVQESFDIKGNYSYLNALAKVEAAEGKTSLQLPEGVTFNGQNSISIDAMHGDRIIDAMKKFFADATFAADGKLNHTMDGEAKTKNYTHNGNNLTFDLYEGGAYKVNATTFPDEDGDRLFIIIPKQAAWMGGMVELVEKENAGLKLDAAQIAALEKEFMETFETFTVILSLSKK